VSRQGDGIELLYALDRPAWGRGYATEAARAVLAYASETLRLPRVVAAVNPANAASQRVLDRLGMHRTGAIRTEIEDLWLYST
jgi:RimJ/RimL family protein N-acetyltransferase